MSTIEDYDHDAVDKSQELDISQVLKDYRKERMFDLLLGPVVSLCFHIVVIVCLALFAVGTTEYNKDEAVVTLVPDKPEDPVIEDPIDPDIPIVEDKIEVPVDVEAVVVETQPVDTSVVDPIADMPVTDDDMETDSVLEVEISNSIKTITYAGGGKNRGGPKRGAAIVRYGGIYGHKTQLAVMRTLRWLKYHQRADGSWPETGKGYTPAMTGLSLLCFLAHAETPADSKEFGETVRKAIEWLMANTSPNKITDRGYSYVIAVYALSEAYGMTQAPKIGAALPRLLKPIIDGQDAQNGWAYNFKKGGGPSQTDMSLSGWCIQTLHAAAATDVEVNGLTEALEKGVKLCEGAITYENGLGKYRLNAAKGNRMSMGAAAALCMQLLGENQNGKVSSVYQRIMKAFKKDDKGLFDWKGKAAVSRNQHHNFIGYDWYYQTQVVFQKMKEKAWKRWNKNFLYGQVTKNQVVEVAKEARNGVAVGTKLGFWPLPSGGGSSNSQWERYYSTTLCCLQLEVYYRYLRGSKRPAEEAVRHDEENSNSDTIFGDDELQF